MARQKKEGVYTNFYLDRNLSNKLERYCELTDRTKTSALERALREFFERAEKDGLKLEGDTNQ